MTTQTLTPQQIKNWRSVLVGLVGPYAYLMPDVEVQRMRDEMQAHLDMEAKMEEFKAPEPEPPAKPENLNPMADAFSKIGL